MNLKLDNSKLDNLEINAKLFINKYQPQSFNDFNSNSDVIKILNTLVIMNNLNILLVGDSSSGKTSLLNTIIKEYFCGISEKEYIDNVLYINSLKEQGINYYRTDVKTFCQTSSIIKNKKKIIVLDDIDTINEQSQQVFRNFIDKYSHNVQFISSCNNIQKVIESLQSRLNIIKLKSFETDTLVSILNKIKTIENIEIDKDAEEFILNISNNTIKILVNYMEKFKLLEEKITINHAHQLCCNISFVIFEEYTNLIKQQNIEESIKLIYEIYDKGYSVMDIIDNYFLFVKNTNLLNENEKYKIIPYICKYITIFHNIHEDEIELALFTNNIINELSKNY
jgi:DNA polymerase III delta prime subunit